MTSTSTPPPVLQLGTRVSVTAGQGYVRFVGQTSFAAGKWIGVELDDFGGKNDGSVGGKRYFSTDEGRGVFVKPSGVRIVNQEGGRESPTPQSAQPARSASTQGLGASTSRPASSLAAKPKPAAMSRTSTTTSRPATRPSSVLSSSGLRSPSPSKATAPPSLASKLARPPSSAASSTSAQLSRQSLATRQVSPKKPVANFAPPSLAPGTNPTALRPTPAGRAPPVRRPSSSAASTSSALSGLGSRRISSPTKALLSPEIVSGRKPLARRSSAISSSSQGADEGPKSESMERVLSGTDSLLDEQILEEEVDQPESEDLTETLPPPSASSKPDPFSLQQAPRKVAEPSTVPKRDYEELLAKLRIVESRRAEDRDRLKEAEKVLEEKEDWTVIREKTRVRITELGNEVRELRKQNKELQVTSDAIQNQFNDLNDQVEISLLDKEVAEEHLEATQAETALLKEKVAELEVEVTVLRDENKKLEGEGDEMIASGQVAIGGHKSNLAYIQFEKQNGRLKDALVRLRDLTSETEAEHKARILDLEKELDLTSDLQSMLDNTVVELERAEAQVDDLKQQLDDALGAEDMLEQLTERNLALTEKVEELSAAVEDLEALQELNDELEENHVETEKQLQEDIDVKEMQLREMVTRIETLEDNVVDYEGTITQFRELVHSLQSDLENLREHQANKESESQSLTSQSQAMLNLNLKLQSSVLKSQVKTIDLELRKLEALQAVEHFAIVKPYLLPAFFDEDSDAVDALMFFERISRKADLISLVIEQNHNVAESLNTVVPEALIGVCETRAKFGRYSAYNKRFAAHLKRCTPEAFLKMGQIYREVSGSEKRIDAFIEALKKEEFKEVECGRELDGLIAQYEHLADLHLQDQALDLAERERSSLTALELDFDTIAAAAGFTKQALALVVKDPELGAEVDENDLDSAFFDPLQKLVNMSRTSKTVIKKLLRRLDDLVVSSSALSLEHMQGFETLAFNSGAIATAVSQLANEISNHLSELRTHKSAFSLPSIVEIGSAISASELGKSNSKGMEAFNALLEQLSKDIATTLAAAVEADSVVKLTYEAPWIARVQELQSNAATNVEAERTVLRLNEEMKDLVRQMRLKEQSHQESILQIELLDKRMESTKKQAEAMVELENELSKAKKQERAYEEAIEALQGDLDTMEAELAKLKANPGLDRDGPTTDSSSYEGSMETHRLVETIGGLRSAIKFLRSENSFLKSQDLLASLSSLPSYSTTTTSTSNLSSGFANKKTLTPKEHGDKLESRLLLQEVRRITSHPKVVDLSMVNKVSLSSCGKKKGWIPLSQVPENQLDREREKMRDLARRVERVWLRSGGGGGGGGGEKGFKTPRLVQLSA